MTAKGIQMLYNILPVPPMPLPSSLWGCWTHPLRIRIRPSASPCVLRTCKYNEATNGMCLFTVIHNLTTITSKRKFLFTLCIKINEIYSVAHIFCPIFILVGLRNLDTIEKAGSKEYVNIWSCQVCVYCCCLKCNHRKKIDNGRNLDLC